MVPRRDQKVKQLGLLEFIMVVIITLDPTENVIHNMFIKNLKLIIWSHIHRLIATSNYIYSYCVLSIKFIMSSTKQPYSDKPLHLI